MEKTLLLTLMPIFFSDRLRECDGTYNRRQSCTLAKGSGKEDKRAAE